jgi:Kinesin motor domain
MGVLEFIKNENAGIIPRTISRIFKYADQELALYGSVTKVSLSFLQLYRETVQDLLAPLSSETANTSQRSIKTTFESNLAIREDPTRGFYVEYLQEFEVSNYSEAGKFLRQRWFLC